ncbi:enolase C-terminal domain-like protein [Streptomyces chartreusis]
MAGTSSRSAPSASGSAPTCRSRWTPIPPTPWRTLRTSPGSTRSTSSLIEQPLAGDGLRGHAALATQIRTPIWVDDSITSASAAAAILLGACQVVNVKPARVGGYLGGPPGARRMRRPRHTGGPQPSVEGIDRERRVGEQPSQRCPAELVGSDGLSAGGLEQP